MEHNMWQDWAARPVGGAMDSTVTTGSIRPRMIVRGSPDMVISLPASLPNQQQSIERRTLLPTSAMLPYDRCHKAFAGSKKPVYCTVTNLTAIMLQMA